MSRKQIMQDLVKDEAKKLKKLATKAQLNKLNFTKLNPLMTRDCIYGQMTGDCYNLKAKELIISCAKRTYICNYEVQMDKCKLNGPPTGFRKDYYSPIEVFIVQPNN